MEIDQTLKCEKNNVAQWYQKVWHQVRTPPPLWDEFRFLGNIDISERPLRILRVPFSFTFLLQYLFFYNTPTCPRGILLENGSLLLRRTLFSINPIMKTKRVWKNDIISNVKTQLSWDIALWWWKESRVTLACLYRTSGQFYMLQTISVDSRHFTQPEQKVPCEHALAPLVIRKDHGQLLIESALHS